MVFLTEFFRSREQEKGQALLIVVLVIVVTLTVGLSLASRSIVQLRNTTDEANSQAAFSAAEAGVEQATKLGNVNGSGVISGINLNDKNNSQISTVDVTIMKADSVLINNGTPLFQDNGADLWLTPYDTNQANLFDSTKAFNGTLTIYWGTNTNPCVDPAVEILIISGTRTSPTLSKYAYDQCGSNSTQPIKRANGFPDAPQKVTSQTQSAFTISGTNGSTVFNYKAQIAVGSGLIARIIPLYNSGQVGASGIGLPDQGKIITSTGTAGISNQQVVRKVGFFQGHEQLPIQFYYSLFTSR